MKHLQESKRAWDNYKNWERAWNDACNGKARLEQCWELNGYMLRAKERWEKTSHFLSVAEVMQVTAEAA
jgi:hypothetical protein